ncbi:hypothetical protein KY327_03080 [Candidatus Woesearchaeota archaeon]|nr:hypothetical protein [Candidatus Woesearchaeota archaeon]
MPLSFGTGTFHKLKLTTAQQRAILDSLPVDGVEACTATMAEVEELLRDEEHLRFLKKYQHNTLHAPFKDDFRLAHDSEGAAEKITTLARSINARHIVFHRYNTDSVDTLERLDYPFTVENTVTGGWHGEQLTALFKEHPDLKLTLDTSHALHFGEEELQRLTTTLKENTAQVHLSNVIEGRHHRQFTKEGGEERLKRILGRLPKRELLITVEENFDDIRDIKPELDLIKKVLGE